MKLQEVKVEDLKEIAYAVQGRHGPRNEIQLMGSRAKKWNKGSIVFSANKY